MYGDESFGDVLDRGAWHMAAWISILCNVIGYTEPLSFKHLEPTLTASEAGIDYTNGWAFMLGEAIPDRSFNEICDYFCKVFGASDIERDMVGSIIVQYPWRVPDPEEPGEDLTAPDKWITPIASMQPTLLCGPFRGQTTEPPAHVLPLD